MTPDQIADTILTSIEPFYGALTMVVVNATVIFIVWQFLSAVETLSNWIEDRKEAAFFDGSPDDNDEDHLTVEDREHVNAVYTLYSEGVDQDSEEASRLYDQAEYDVVMSDSSPDGEWEGDPYK